MEDIVLLAGARTPMTEYNGAFADVSAIELGVHAAKEALARSRTEPGEIDHVIFGNALQTSGDAIYGARHVALRSGVPKEVPALTVNRLCGSGFEAIVQAAHRIQLGEARTVLAGGMENMTQAPHVIRGARKGFRLGQGQLEDSLMVALFDSYAGLYMAQTSDRVAARYGITRQAQDEYALSSQKRAAAAWQACRLSEEVVAVEARSGKKTVRVEKDDHLRPDTTLEALAALPPSFGKDGQVTAGNASGIVDGAAAVVVTTASRAKEKGRKPLGRLVSSAVVGCDPELMGLGPAPAARAALARAGLKLEQIDLWEINEAFAGQILGVVAELGLDREKLNVNGGAIALGHPLAATGTRCTLTLLYEMRRRGVRYGVAGACIGGGQGIAVVVESAA
ncbi:MAG TPA: acetyl-CoA C-acyltransferase [Thermoanaerobaculia bacterium]|nr:acetyl-CoA C-acyltransferase [Thermoanaerobaculia bacterium]